MLKNVFLIAKIFISETSHTNDVRDQNWCITLKFKSMPIVDRRMRRCELVLPIIFAHIWLVIVQASCEVEFGKIVIVFYSAERVSFVQYGSCLLSIRQLDWSYLRYVNICDLWCLLRSSFPSSIWRLNCTWIFPFLLFWMQRRVLLYFDPLISSCIICNLTE